MENHGITLCAKASIWPELGRCFEVGKQKDLVCVCGHFGQRERGTFSQSNSASDLSSLSLPSFSLSADYHLACSRERVVL